jgi:hypothetical protein
MRDDLAEWLAIRESIDWSLGACVHGPIAAQRDGAVHFVRTAMRGQDATKAERMLTALTRVRLDARDRRPLTFARLAAWQALVLDCAAPPPFRRQPAFAKGGRERYGIDDETQTRLEKCLADADAPAFPLAARTARVFLDVLFFHPFDDGNARSAGLAAEFVLAKADVRLDQVGPLWLVARYAHDRAGAQSLVRLVDVLIEATRQRREHAI